MGVGKTGIMRVVECRLLSIVEVSRNKPKQYDNMVIKN
jgi:hypothetical protein